MDLKECPRCDRKTLTSADFPPRRRICRTCYTMQVAACHARAGYKPPRATLHQIRVWRILNQLRTDASTSPLFACCGWPPITSRQVSAIMSKAGATGKGVALLPSRLLPSPALFDFRPEGMRLVSLEQRRSLLKCASPQAYASAMAAVLLGTV